MKKGDLLRDFFFLEIIVYEVFGKQKEEKKRFTIHY
jgi:hypothetical protein